MEESDKEVSFLLPPLCRILSNSKYVACTGSSFNSLSTRQAKKVTLSFKEYSSANHLAHTQVL